MAGEGPRDGRGDRGPQIAAGGAALGAELYPPRGRYRRYREGDELDHLAFAVPDVDAFFHDHRGDFRVVMAAFDEGTDRLAYVTDPDGVWIELMSARKRREPRRRSS